MDNTSSANSSSSSPEWMTLENTPTLYVELIVFPFLLLIATVGSVATLIIFFTVSDKRAATIYLICIAMADLCVLWLALPGYITELQITAVALPEGRWIYDDYFLYRPIGESFLQNLLIQFSDWTLIVLCVERLFVIARPFRPPRSNSRKYSRRAVVLELLLLILAAVATIHNPIAQYMDALQPDVITPTSMKEWAFLQSNAEQVHPAKEMQETNNRRNTLFYLTGLTIGKWIALVLINVMLVVAIFRHNAKPAVHGIVTEVVSQNPAATWTLICLVLLYGVTQLPNVVFRCMKIASEPPYRTYHLTAYAKRNASLLVHILVLVNYAVAPLLMAAVGLTNRKFYRRRSSFPPDRSNSADTLETFEL